MACEYTFHEASTSFVTAFSEDYVSNTFEKVVICLDFLNSNTETAFYRARMKVDTQFEKRASKVNRDRTESGWMSTIKGIVADKPRKLRGQRVQTLYFEEAGSNPILLDTYTQSRPLVEILGKRVGSRFVFGTGGDNGPNLAGIKKMFYNPQSYFILPYKHTYSKDGSVSYTGYFIPAFSMWFGWEDPNTKEKIEGFDSRGVVYEDRAKEYYNKHWEKITDPSDRIKDQAEYCFAPEDAFLLEGHNSFNQEKLVDQLHQIEIHKNVPKPGYLKLYWQLTDGISDPNKMPKYEVVQDSKIQFTELPMQDEHGNTYSNLYVMGVDGIDQDKTTSTGQGDVSKFCIVVYRRMLGLQPPKPVAVYLDRPKSIKDAWEVTLKLAMFYNAKVMVEATRTSVVQYFKQQKKDHFLMRRPKATANSTGKTNFKQIGAPAVQHIIEHQLDLIENYIEEYCDQIQFPDMLNELITYSYENKRKFDQVAALGMALLADEDMIGKTTRINGETKKLNFGYQKNEYGQMQFGSIKENNKEKIKYALFGGRSQSPY